MKTALALASFASIAGLALACNSSSSSTLDADSALNQFQNPTGTFGQQNGSDAFSGYQSEKTKSSKVAVPSAGGSGSGTSNTQSLHILANPVGASGGASKCAQGQTCRCDASGTYVFNEQPSNVGKGYRFQFNQCVNADGSQFDGEVALIVSPTPFLGIAPRMGGASSGASNGAGIGGGNGLATQSVPSGSSMGNTGNGGSGYGDGSGYADDDDSLYGDDDDDGMGMGSGSGSGFVSASESGSPSGSAGTSSDNTNFLLTAKGTAGDKTTPPTPIEFSLGHESGYTLLSVDVADGNIVVGISADHSAFVKSKQGTWNCKPNAQSGYACTSNNGGGNVDVGAAAGASTAAGGSGNSAGLGQGAGNGRAASGGGGESGLIAINEAVLTASCTPQSGASACTACVLNSCCKQVDVCTTDSFCVSMSGCMSKCSDKGCVSTCTSQYDQGDDGQGNARYQDILSCALNLCPDSCK